MHTSSGNHERTNTFRDLGARQNERVDLLEIVVPFDGLEGLLARHFLEQVRLSSSRRLVALDAVALDENTIHGDHVTRLQIDNVSNKDVVDGDFASPVLLLFVELDELPFLLPVVRRTHNNHNDNGDNNGDTFDPLDSRLARLMLYAKSLVQSQGQRNDSSARKQDQDLVVVGHPG